MFRALALSALLAFPLSASVLDQRQQNVDPDGFPIAVGGFSQQKLAQTVTAGLDGSLEKVRLPIACSDGTLVMQIVELAPSGTPTGRVLSVARAAASGYPPTVEPVWRDIFLPRPIPMTAGTRFAIVLDNPTGSCSVRPAPPGDFYGGGDGWFNDAVNGHRWLTFKEFVGSPNDLPFETWLVSGASDGGGFCKVERFGYAPPIPHWTPLCRCVESDFPREQRCGMFDPRFTILRRIPLPLVPGKDFTVLWSLFPHEQLDGAFEIMDVLPPSFDAKWSGVLFDAGGIAPAEGVTLGYEARAGDLRKKDVIETTISVGGEQIRMTTAIPVPIP